LSRRKLVGCILIRPTLKLIILSGRLLLATCQDGDDKSVWLAITGIVNVNAFNTIDSSVILSLYVQCLFWAVDTSKIIKNNNNKADLYTAPKSRSH